MSQQCNDTSVPMSNNPAIKLLHPPAQLWVIEQLKHAREQAASALTEGHNGWEAVTWEARAGALALIARDYFPDKWHHDDEPETGSIAGPRVTVTANVPPEVVERVQTILNDAAAEAEKLIMESVTLTSNGPGSGAPADEQRVGGGVSTST